MMFVYAQTETDNSYRFLWNLLLVVERVGRYPAEGKVMTYLRPDAKSQVTIEYSDDNKP